MSENPTPTTNLFRYFGYAHLPPHLQAASKPFHDAAHDYWSVALTEEDCAEALQTLSNEVRYWSKAGNIAGTPIHDPREMEVASEKLHRATEVLHGQDKGSVLRLILEAKDCAVRSLIAPK